MQSPPNTARPVRPPDARFRCSVCDGGVGERLLQAPDYPAYLLPLPVGEARSVRRAPITAWRCLECGHLQQSDPDPALQAAIYADYYDHYRMDSVEAQVPTYRQPFEAFVAKQVAELPRGVWLEIGCSNGASVEFLARFADRYVGIDPSSRLEIAQARHPGHTFLAGRFPDAVGDLTFDVAVSQFLLEHISDGGGFLDALHAHARTGAALIAQVPDAGDYATRGQPNFLAHEHTQYFRQAQLELMLRRHGWIPTAWGPRGPSLIVAARRGAPEQPPMPDAALRDWSRQRALYEQRVELPDGPVLFYGIGPLLFWMLGHGAPAGPVYVVDDNPSYHGTAVPGFGWPIQALDPALLSVVRTVVLSLNPIYHETVMARLAATGQACRVLACANGSWHETLLPAPASPDGRAAADPAGALSGSG
jgi:SAM-dependent methyltransferase